MTRYFITYYLVLIAFLVASFIPEHRIWGINWWAYFPQWAPFALFAIAITAPIFFWKVMPKDRGLRAEPVTTATETRTFSIASAATTVVFVGLFYFLREQIYFLGDAYQLLSKLSTDHPMAMVSREIGESFVHIVVRSLLTGPPDQTALAAYRIVSILSGVLLIFLVSTTAVHLFESNRDRFLFLAGVATGGYMLLYFGYVENYSMFTFTVMAFSLVGLRIARKQLNRFLILPLLLLACASHVLGVTLVPGTVYLLFADSGVSRRLVGANRYLKTLLGLSAAIVVGFTFYHFYSTSSFFRISIIPLIAHRFTAEGYTLFSLNHLIDYLNLMILLLPGLPLLLMVLPKVLTKDLAKRCDYRFLAVVLASTLGAVFVFDPRLGMPRDWDLFSFAGIPLAIALYYTIIDNRHHFTGYRNICTMAVLLSLLTLMPRAVSLAIPPVGVKHFESYLKLDNLKSRVGYSFLVKYYTDIGDHYNAQIAIDYWNDQYPQRDLLTRCQQVYLDGDADEAFRLCTKATEIDPLFYIPYFQLGCMYLDRKEPDSALAMFDDAIGLNPFGVEITYGQALAYLQKGDTGRAEDAFVAVTERTERLIDARLYLMDLYEARADGEQYLKQLVATGIRDDAPVRVITELGEYWISEERYADAAICYRRALAKGLDSTYVRSLAKLHPQLVKYLK